MEKRLLPEMGGCRRRENEIGDSGTIPEIETQIKLIDKLRPKPTEPWIESTVSPNLFTARPANLRTAVNSITD
jgi:hypothetical protein